MSLEEIPNDEYFREHDLSRIGWADACAVMTNAFYRTRRDEPYADLVIYIAESDAVGRFEALLHTVDPEGISQDLESVKEMYTLLHVLENWRNEARHLNHVPRPLLFEFDSVTLQKILNGEKTCLITVMKNGDCAYGISCGMGLISYHSFQRGWSFRGTVNYEIGH